MASIWAKIGRIVYGASRRQVHEMYFEDRHLDTMDFVTDAFRDDITLSGGVLDAECAALYVGAGRGRAGKRTGEPVTGLRAQIWKKGDFAGYPLCFARMPGSCC